MIQSVTRVVVVDDHPGFRLGLRTLLRSLAGVVVGEAATAAEAVSATMTLQPDVVFMDLALGDGRDGTEGVAATAAIHEAAPHVAVVALTMSVDAAALAAVLRAGARGYLVKGANREEIKRALHTVTGGGIVIGGGMAGHLASVVSAQADSPPQPSGRALPPSLTPRQRDVLAELATGADNETIAARLGLAPKTVRNNLSEIFLKLAVSSRVEAVLRAREAGLG
jgi:DNA-binding NarL/FixJ family response regulator